jgi:hypothetical protein
LRSPQAFGHTRLGVPLGDAQWMLAIPKSIQVPALVDMASAP